MLADFIIIGFLFVLGVWDGVKLEIPLKLTYSFIACVMILKILYPFNLINSIIIAIIIFISGWLLWMFSGELSGTDIMVVTAIAFFSGFKPIYYTALIVIIPLIYYVYKVIPNTHEDEAVNPFPFVAFLFLGQVSHTVFKFYGGS